jgi:hypothetical protein
MAGEGREELEQSRSGDGKEEEEEVERWRGGEVERWRGCDGGGATRARDLRRR